MFDLTPSQVFGLYLLIPCIAGLAYLIGFGRARVRLRARFEELLHRIDQLEAPPYFAGDHTNCTICAHRLEPALHAPLDELG